MYRCIKAMLCLLVVGCFVAVFITRRMLKFVRSEFANSNIGVMGDLAKLMDKNRFFSKIFSPCDGTFCTAEDASNNPDKTFGIPAENITQSKSCVEKRHLVFIKVHKAGSTTVTKMLIRFGVARNLSFALPRGLRLSFWQDDVLQNNLFKYPRGLPFDLLCSHAVYSKVNMDKIMHEDTLYFGIVREPISRVHSAIHFHSMYRETIPGDHKLSQYIQNPQIVPDRRLVNNSMSYEFGLPPADFFNMRNIKIHLNKLNEAFSVIIVMERMPESLLMIRRRMCWEMKDILYIPKNINKLKPDLNISDQEVNKLTNLLMADVALYKFSVERLDKQIAEQGEGFWNELEVYRSMLIKVRDYCLAPGNTTNPILTFSRTRWSDQFTLDEHDCYLIKDKKAFTLMSLRRYQYPEYYKI